MAKATIPANVNPGFEDKVWAADADERMREMKAADSNASLEN